MMNMSLSTAPPPAPAPAAQTESQRLKIFYAAAVWDVCGLEDISFMAPDAA